jgi:hypothetical protein
MKFLREINTELHTHTYTHTRAHTTLSKTIGSNVGRVSEDIRRNSFHKNKETIKFYCERWMYNIGSYCKCINVYVMCLHRNMRLLFARKKNYIVTSLGVGSWSPLTSMKSSVYFVRSPPVQKSSKALLVDSLALRWWCTRDNNHFGAFCSALNIFYTLRKRRYHSFL